MVLEYTDEDANSFREGPINAELSPSGAVKDLAGQIVKLNGEAKVGWIRSPLKRVGRTVGSCGAAVCYERQSARELGDAEGWTLTR